VSSRGSAGPGFAARVGVPGGCFRGTFAKDGRGGNGGRGTVVGAVWQCLADVPAGRRSEAQQDADGCFSLEVTLRGRKSLS